MNYKINDIILYGSAGICRIGEITEKIIDSAVFRYYILNPVYDEKSTIFVPLENKELIGKIRDIPTEEEIDNAVSSVCNETADWISDSAKRKDYLKQVTDFGSVYQLLSALKALYTYREKQFDCGKKLHVADEFYLKDIEKILADEFAYIKNFERSSVRSFLKNLFGFED